MKDVERLSSRQYKTILLSQSASSAKRARKTIISWKPPAFKKACCFCGGEFRDWLGMSFPADQLHSMRYGFRESIWLPVCMECMTLYARIIFAPPRDACRLFIDVFKAPGENAPAGPSGLGHDS